MEDNSKGKSFTFIEVVIPIDENIQPGVVYWCPDDYRIDLVCPCGCNEVITLNTLADTKPCWSIQGNSIKPSINRIVGCKSHFTITNSLSH